MLTVGTVLRDRYRILRVLGSGGFGDTYLAEDRDLPSQPKCVVKQLRPKDSNPEVFAIARGLFEREAEYLYKIGNAHPEIPDLFAHFTEGGEFYLVQEFIDGDNLAKEIPTGKKLSEPETIRLLLDILEVLSFVHQQNVIHRDIKLSNLLRRKSDGKVVLIDFGAVKDVSTIQSNSQGLTNMTVSIGSPGYMPSEQAQGKPKLSSDVYAVGMIGIQALTGVYPADLPEDVNTGEILWQSLVQVSPDFAQVLQQMTHYHFGQRYKSAIEALSALRTVVQKGNSLPTQIISTSTSPNSPPTRPQPPTAIASQSNPHSSANPLFMGGVFVTIGVAIAGGIWFAASRPQVTTANTPTETPIRTPTTTPTERPRETPTTPTPTTRDFFGAIARSPNTQDKGYAWNYPTRQAAERSAIERCSNVTGASDCTVMVWFRNACGSLAEADNGGAGSGWGIGETAATASAIQSCSTVGENCRVIKTFCTERQP